VKSAMATGSGVVNSSLRHGNGDDNASCCGIIVVRITTRVKCLEEASSCIWVGGKE
jgi:hypothetical protein